MYLYGWRFNYRNIGRYVQKEELNHHADNFATTMYYCLKQTYPVWIGKLGKERQIQSPNLDSILLESLLLSFAEGRDDHQNLMAQEEDMIWNLKAAENLSWREGASPA